MVRDAPQVETMFGVLYRKNSIKTLEDLLERTSYCHFGILVSTEVENNIDIKMHLPLVFLIFIIQNFTEAILTHKVIFGYLSTPKFKIYIQAY